MVANEEHIPPLERHDSLMGRLFERSDQQGKTLDRVESKVDVVVDAIKTDVIPRIQSLEEDRRQRDRRTALIGGGSGLGGMGIAVAFWQAVEAIFKGLPK